MQISNIGHERDDIIKDFTYIKSTANQYYG